MAIFIVLAAIGLVYLGISALHGDHGDLHGHVEIGGASFLSPRAIAIFLLSFGTVGALGQGYGQTTLVSSLWGFGSGIAMIVVYLLAMGAIQSQQASSLVLEHELIGHTGRITVAIPADGLGEVSCGIKAQSIRRMARTKNRQPIAEGSIVRIVESQADLVFVELVETKS